MKKITLFFLLISIYSFSQPLAQFYQNTPVSGTDFGTAVDIYNDDIVVSTNSFTLFGPVSVGKVYLFNRVGGIHQTDILYPDDAQVSDLFGNSISINGDFVAVGSPLHDAAGENSGAVYLYYKTNSGWELLQKLTASDATAQDQFGGSVKVSGNTLFVMSRQTVNPNVGGSVYIYNFNGTNWVFSQKLQPADAEFGGISFGKMDVQGDTLAVAEYSAGSESYTGLQIFNRDGNDQWSYHNTIIIGSLEEIVHDYSLSGNHVYILNNNIDGEVYFDVFVQDVEFNWSAVSRTHIDDHIGDFQYTRIEAADDDIFFGATSYTLQMERKFPVLHYTRGGTYWMFQNALYGTYNSYDDYFGVAMQSQGTNIVIGAPLEGTPLLTGRAYYFDAALATANFEKKSNTLYPNPTAGVLSIGGDAKIQGVEVHSLTGSLLLSTVGNTNQISLDRFSNGVYFVKLRYENGSEKTHKVIKN